MGAWIFHLRCPTCTELTVPKVVLSAGRRDGTRCVVTGTGVCSLCGRPSPARWISLSGPPATAVRGFGHGLSGGP